MRKSSQGGRRVSQPLRNEDRGRSSIRRTIDRGASAIPLPNSRGRRSSSENRDSRMSALQPMKRSKSQINTNLVTPGSAVTPLRFGQPHFGSAQSQRFLSPFSDGGLSSRKSTYSGAGGSKPGRVVKDSRPLTDKSFQQQLIQKITSFLFSQPDALSFAPKGINLRQLTTKIFVDTVNYLMNFMDGGICVNMTNYVTEIPIIMKKWGYVGNLNTSWLKTVNTQHALPHVLGLLSWLVTLASAVLSNNVEAVIQDALQHEDDEDFPYGSAQVYMQHLFNQYNNWNSKNEEAEENEERRFIQELCNRNGVSEEELSEVAQGVSNYENQLDDPKEKAEIEAAMEEEKKYTEFLQTVNSMIDYKNRMEEFLNTAETELQNENLNLKNQEDLLHQMQNNIIDLKDQLSRQVMSAEERDEILKECSDLSSTIRENEEYISVLSNQIYSDDLSIVKKGNNVKKKTQAYNKIIITESCWLPELETLKDEINILHPGAQDELAELNSLAHKLKSDVQKKVVNIALQMKQLKAELLQVEEKKSKDLQELEQYLQKVKESEKAIDAVKSQSVEETAEMKKTIASLKANAKDRLHWGALGEAKEQLLKLTEKREYGKKHLENIKENARIFFKREKEIFQGLIDDVTRAQGKISKMLDELEKNFIDNLAQVNFGIDHLGTEVSSK